MNHHEACGVCHQPMCICALVLNGRCTGLKGRKPIWCIEYFDGCEWVYVHGDWYSLDGAEEGMKGCANPRFKYRIVRVEETRTVVSDTTDAKAPETHYVSIGEGETIITGPRIDTDAKGAK